MLILKIRNTLEKTLRYVICFAKDIRSRGGLALFWVSLADLSFWVGVCLDCVSLLMFGVVDFGMGLRGAKLLHLAGVFYGP